MRKKTLIVSDKLVAFVCLVTNLSQLPILVKNGLTQFVSIPIWLIFIAYLIVKGFSFILDGAGVPIVIGTILAVFLGVGQFFNQAYLDSSLYYNVFLSIMILIVGNTVGQHIKPEGIETVFMAYIISGLVVSANVFYEYIFGRDISGLTYAYASKNSVSQILLTTLVLIVFTRFDKGKKYKPVFVAAAAFEVLNILSLKSRATIVALPIVAIAAILYGKINKKVRVVVIFVLVIAVILLSNKGIYDKLMQDILTAGRDVDDLNSLSSGRYIEWQKFPEQFKEFWTFGAGRMKRESIILTALLEYGAFMGSAILALGLYPLYWNIFRYGEKDKLYYTMIAVSVCYAINGIFEQLAPFGPGVKCYFLWFLLGIMMAYKRRRIEYKSEML